MATGWLEGRWRSMVTRRLEGRRSSVTRGRSVARRLEGRWSNVAAGRCVFLVLLSDGWKIIPRGQGSSQGSGLLQGTRRPAFVSL